MEDVTHESTLEHRLISPDPRVKFPSTGQSVSEKLRFRGLTVDLSTGRNGELVWTGPTAGLSDTVMMSPNVEYKYGYLLNACVQHYLPFDFDCFFFGGLVFLFVHSGFTLIGLCPLCLLWL